MMIDDDDVENKLDLRAKILYEIETGNPGEIFDGLPAKQKLHWFKAASVGIIRQENIFIPNIKKNKSSKYNNHDLFLLSLSSFSCIIFMAIIMLNSIHNKNFINSGDIICAIFLLSSLQSMKEIIRKRNK